MMDTKYEAPESSLPTTLRDCPSCGDEREFEQPPCVDGHGADCPEWSCVDCGHAIVVEFDLEIEVGGTADSASTVRTAARPAEVDRVSRVSRAA